jgi:chromosome segregation ATPase
MDLVVMILAAMSGALIGSSTGIFLMYRKLRPVNAGELDALRTKLRTMEFDLNAAIGIGVKLKKEAAEQASKVSDQVIEKQQQLDAALAAKNLESAHRNAAEQRIAELIAEVDAGRARSAEIEAQAKELAAKAAEMEGKTAEVPSPAGEEQQRQLATFQARVETGGRQIQELTDQVTRLVAEAAELKQRSDEAEKVRTAVEAELKQRSEEAEQARTALEVDLTGERQRLRALTEQVLELQSARSAQDVRMQEERESAAKGMELLVMAQQNLSRVIQAAGTEAPAANGNNGTNGHTPVAAEAPAANGNGHSEAVPAEVKLLQAAALQ